MTPTALSEHLSRDIESVCRHLLPGGRKVGNDWCAGDVSGDEGRSLKICLSGDKVGVGSDFATGETFGDLLDLWMAVEKVDLREAMARACSYLGLAIDGESSRPKRQYQRPEKPKSIRRLTESRVHEYLRSRGLTDRALEDFRVCEDGDWIVFPYLRDGVHLNTTYLHVDRPDGKKNIRKDKNAEPTLFGWHALETRFPNTRHCVITEGQIDAITLHQCGIPALSVPNGGGGGRKQDWIDSDYDHLQRFDALYLALDDDPAGQEAEAEIVRRLGADRCRLVKLPHKDANECWQKGIRDFKRYLLSARALDPDELKPASRFTDRVIDEFYPSPGTHRGIRSPWTGWNLRFHRPELIVWVGFSGSGKSTLLNQIAAESLIEGERWCIASMEMPAADTLATIVRQLSGQERPSRERVTEIMGWLGERLWIFDLVGTAKADRMLEVFKYAVRRYNIKNFVIDSLTKCGIPEKEIDLQKGFAEAIVDFNRSHDCITHLVTHSRKLESEDRPPTKSDVRGAGALTDIAHTVVAVWRYVEPAVDESRYRPRKKVEEIPTIKPDTVLVVSKNRKKGWLGNFNLWFDPASRQFREDVAAPVLARFDRRPQRENEIDFD